MGQDFLIENGVLKRYKGSAVHAIIPDGVTSIGCGAFLWCKVERITIPDSVTIIGNYAFSECSSLKTIEYTGTDEQWEEVEKGDKWNPGNINVIYLDNGVEKTLININSPDCEIIGGVLKRYKGSAAHAVISDDIISIGCGAFLWCKSLESITIPNSVTTIGNYAFA